MPKTITLPGGAVLPVNAAMNYMTQDRSGVVRLWVERPSPHYEDGIWHCDGIGMQWVLPFVFSQNSAWGDSLTEITEAPQPITIDIRALIECELRHHEEAMRFHTERLAMGHLRNRAERQEDADALAIEAAQVACLRSILQTIDHPSPL